VQINGKLRSRITVPAEAPESFSFSNALLADEKVRAAIAGSRSQKNLCPGKLVNIVVK